MRRTAFDHGRKENLGKHCAQLSHASTEAVTGAAYASWEDFSGRDEGCCIGAEVEEELRQHVEDEEVFFGKHFPCESEDAEDDGEDEEAADLDAFTAEFIDCEDGEPVSGECAGTRQCQLNASSFRD